MDKKLKENVKRLFFESLLSNIESNKNAIELRQADALERIAAALERLAPEDKPFSDPELNKDLY